MAFEFHQRARKGGQKIALFPGAWNPPTTAHLAIASAALRDADEVIWVLPEAFPHKSFHGAPFWQRLAMLKAIASCSEGFSVATSSAGLYVDIARQARESLPADAQLHLLCGRDAADRIATWDYGRPGVFEEMLEAFPLVVAARAGHYSVAARHQNRIRPLTMESSFDDVSSSEVRALISAGREWRHLVPEVLHDAVSKLYS